MIRVQNGSELKPFLMGAETEYAISGRELQSERSRPYVYELLRDAMRDKYSWLRDMRQHNGSYFQNGSRFYFDYGEHPEYATAECLTPKQVACHEKAGELLIREATREVMARNPEMQITVLKNNICPVSPDSATWATHESYTCWADLDRAAEALIPHIVTRLPFAAAGCLRGRFELSQRARHLAVEVGQSTTGERPLFCTRADRLLDNAGGNWQRIHVLAKDSQRCPFGTYLTFGTTGLLLLLLNAGRTVGKGLELVDPVQAIQAVSQDPMLRTGLRLVDGRRLTALQIQQQYLLQCQEALREGTFPNWTKEVVRHWSETLAGLQRNPLTQARRLDAYCKLALYGRELARAGMTWSDLEEAITRYDQLKRQFSPQVCDAMIAKERRGLAATMRDEFRAAELVVDRWQHPQRLQRLRLAARLLYLDLYFHQLDGLYDRLAETSVVASTPLEPAQIRRAMRRPPRGGRAELRGKHIRQRHGQQWECDWQHVQDFSPLRHTYELTDPFRPTDELVIHDPPTP